MSLTTYLYTKLLDFHALPEFVQVPFEYFMINEYGDKGQRRGMRSFAVECLLYGNEFLQQLGLRKSQKWSHLGVVLGFIHAYREYYVFLCSMA